MLMPDDAFIIADAFFRWIYSLAFDYFGFHFAWRHFFHCRCRHYFFDIFISCRLMPRFISSPLHAADDALATPLFSLSPLHFHADFRHFHFAIFYYTCQMPAPAITRLIAFRLSCQLSLLSPLADAASFIAILLSFQRFRQLFAILLSFAAGFHFRQMIRFGYFASLSFRYAVIFAYLFSMFSIFSPALFAEELFAADTPPPYFRRHYELPLLILLMPLAP
jgi:hypothetical protein